jgi:DNA repair protein RecN (Recombination protein N)
MLKTLRIENYALIKSVEIQFNSGFSTITGETGAGKSIMLDALGLVLGNRADTQVLRDPSRKCIVEAQFILDGYGLEPFFDSMDIDYESESLFRREINPAGKSRGFINDTPVNLQVLKEIGSRLINIHSQHEVLVLNNRDFQLALLDAYAGNENALAAYQNIYKRYTQEKKQLEKLNLQKATYLSQLDYDSFLYEELAAAKPELDSLQELEEKQRMLSNASDIKSTLYRISDLMNGEQLDLLAMLKDVANQLQQYATGNPLAELYERLEAVRIELADITLEADRQNENILDDPEELDSVNERLGHLNHLLQKHRVQDLEQLKVLKEEIGKRLSQHNNLDETIAALEKALTSTHAKLVDHGKTLTETRKQSILPLCTHIEKILSTLGMPDAQLKIKWVPLHTPGPDGWDNITVLFSANKGTIPDMISKIASGGEMSRLMLSLKSVLSQKKLIPTIIFDEIDSGVSGEIAGKTAMLMRSMASNMQVIAITHLPQIASKGEEQFLASKSTEGNLTTSQVTKLTPQERIEAIAKMLSDDNPTTESRANAMQLLGIR